MEFFNINLETLEGYIITAQAFAWNHKLEIGVTLYALLPTFWGRRSWLNAQLYIMFMICGLPAIFCPETYLSFMSQTSDKVNHIHIYLVRWIGVLILSQVLSFWLLSKSSDSTTETSQLCAYTIELGCVAMALFSIYTHPCKKTCLQVHDQMFPAILIGTCLQFLVSFFYALWSTGWGGYTEIVSRRNTHIRLDSLLLFVFGVMWFVSPILVLNSQTDAETTDIFHHFQSRVVGALLFYHAIVSARSVTFLKDSDKDAVIFSHLIGYLMLMTVTAVGQMRNWGNTSLKGVAIMSVDEIFLVFNSVVAMSVDVPKYLTKTFLRRIMQVPQDIQRIKRRRF